MSLNANSAPNAGGKFRTMEAGTYPTRLVHIVDMGLQPQRPYKGEEKDPAYEVLFTYEFVDEFMLDDDGQPDEGKPRFVSEMMPLYGLQAERAKSTQRYNAFDPKGIYNGDFAKCISTPLNVTIVINPGTTRDYENVANVAPMRGKDVEKCPELVNKPVVFDMDNPDVDAFMMLPQWIQNKIKGGLEYEGSKLHGLLGDAEESKPEKEEPVDNNDEDEAPY